MVYSYSDKWDKRERDIDDSDIKNAAEDKDKVTVDVETETEENNKETPIFSGLFCVYDDNFATRIYDGETICNDCFHKEIKHLIKKKKKHSKK